DAANLHLKAISDLAAVAPRLHAGFGQDFINRKDGYPGLVHTYGLRFGEPPREMDLSLTYRALAGGQVDVIAGNSTDGLIDKLNLYQLEDDRLYFPPYEAAPVFGKRRLHAYPQVSEPLKVPAGERD